MEREIINPWQWQEQYGFVHGNKVSGVTSTLYLAGQIAADSDGNCLYPGDMEKQLEQVIANIDSILHQADMDFTNVVRLNVYTVDVPGLLTAHDHMVSLLRAHGCRHAGTLVGVTALADPVALVEIEATAAI
jgi:enamine deaminase RidA (YjgF/YER057c/UK114 family)